jgi:hypothetical protein
MARKDGSPGRIKQIAQVYSLTRQGDPKITLWLVLAFLVPLVIAVAIGAAFGAVIWGVLFGVTLGLLATTIVFGRRAEAAQYNLLRERPGGAAAALNMLRRGWTVTPAVAVDRYQSYISRVTGRPGVVLVGEGQPNRVRHLLIQEKKRIGRVAPEAPVHEFIVGDGEGLTPLPKLVKSVRKLPRALTASQVSEVNRRLKALASQQGMLPVPKGPLPKGTKMPKMPRT